MDIDELKAEIHSRMPLTDYLQKAPHEGYYCPYCDSGHGKHGTGALHIVPQNPYKFKCFKCGQTGDVIDLIAKERGFETWDAMKWAADALGIDISKPQTTHYKATAKDFDDDGDTMQQATETKKEAADYTAYYKDCVARLDDPAAVAYLQGRGISLKTAKAAGVGYDPQADPANNPGNMGLLKGKTPHPTPRLIFPTCKSHYVGRRIDGVNSYAKMNPAGGSPWIFNINALYTAPVVFVAEGVFDALAIMEVGGAAVATCSTSNVGNVLRQLQRKQSAVTLILALDNDKAGITTQREIKAALDKMGVLSLSVELADKGDDPNDALQKDRTAFTVRVREAMGRAYALKKEKGQTAAQGTAEPAPQIGDVPTEQTATTETADPQQAIETAKENYLQGSARAHLDAFRQEIKESADHPPIKTGFKGFDRLLDGGLYPGLYIIGAISSLGKTTFLLQIADSIAAQGIDVLYFSLEMAQNELMARSVSRLTYTETAPQIAALKNELKKKGTEFNPFEDDPETRESLREYTDRQEELRNLESARKSTRGIMNGHRYARYRRDEKALIEKALEKYSTFADHLYFSEGMGNIGVEQIRDKVQEHFSFTGKYPVVMVDYLQILAPNDVRATDKQNTDKAVLELKRISRDYKTPVIAISSFNRDSYKGTNGIVSMTDFKESGAIEYSADILIGLEFQSAGAKADKTTGAEGYNEKVEKNKDPREIRAVIMKNRNGKAWVNKNFNYYPVFNYFEESAQTPPKKKEANGQQAAGKNGNGTQPQGAPPLI